MSPREAIAIRSARRSDFSEWSRLYRGYRAFYELQPDEAVIERVWDWIHDDANEVEAFVALSGELVVGLAHYRRFARPSSGSVGIFLDDLFSDPESRGRGVGRALLREVSALAGREGRSVVRWITAEDNGQARRLHDSAAAPTTWVTYDLAPGSL